MAEYTEKDILIIEAGSKYVTKVKPYKVINRISKTFPELKSVKKLVIGKEIVEINKRNKTLIFPSDGYITLEFAPDTWINQGITTIERAAVRIFGASGDQSFVLKKSTTLDDQSKEVFVRKGMRCEFVDATDKAKIRFIPLV